MHDNKLVIIDLAYYTEDILSKDNMNSWSKTVWKKKINSLSGKSTFQTVSWHQRAKISGLSMQVWSWQEYFLRDIKVPSICLRWQLLTYKLKKKSLILNEIADTISIFHISIPGAEVKILVWRVSLPPLWNTTVTLFCLQRKVI